MDNEQQISQLLQKVQQLEERIEKMEKPSRNLSRIEEKLYGLKVRDKFIVPKKKITASGACPIIGEIAQRTNTDGDLYICGRNNTWEKVGSQ